MTREQLADVLSWVSRIAQTRDVLVYGSQSILGSYSENELPPEATGSMEVDITFFDDPDDDKSSLVDAAIGALSDFHNEYGYYPQGVSITTAKLTEGWEDRLVPYETPRTKPGRGLCLEPHDCILAKLVRFEEKDVNFAVATRPAPAQQGAHLASAPSWAAILMSLGLPVVPRLRRLPGFRWGSAGGRDRRTGRSGRAARYGYRSR